MANAITQTARAWVANRLGATGGGSFASAFFVAWGNGSGQSATAADTAIFGEAPTGRAAATATPVSINTSGYNDGLRLAATLTADANRTIDNVGVLDAASGGNLFLHSNFAAMNLLTSDVVNFQFTLVFV